MALLGGLGALIPVLTPVLDKILSRSPDPADRLRAESEARQMLADSEARIFEAARDVLVAETTGSKLQRMWRPIAMLNFLALINYVVVIAPFFGLVDETLDALSRVPAELWTLITVGMGGYVLGRSGEKMMERWGQNK